MAHIVEEINRAFEKDSEIDELGMVRALIMQPKMCVSPAPACIMSIRVV